MQNLSTGLKYFQRKWKFKVYHFFSFIGNYHWNFKLAKHLNLEEKCYDLLLKECLRLHLFISSVRSQTCISAHPPLPQAAFLSTLAAVDKCWKELSLGAQILKEPLCVHRGTGALPQLPLKDKNTLDKAALLFITTTFFLQNTWLVLNSYFHKNK